MNLTLAFEDPQATRPDLSGGKGANLARLAQQGFPVPTGFIVTARGYRDFLARQEPPPHPVDPWPFDHPSALRAAATRLRNDLARLPLPPGLSEEVANRLQAFPAGQTFSVRSSSTLEDLAGAAFAGQHETYLNVADLKTILARIKDCWLSLWQDRAVTYRHQQGFSQSSADMAVVVQVLVPCEVAGVAFSINPVSGDLDEICIDANFGLGESVVSGEGAVDHWTLDRANGSVREARIACKDRRMICVHGGTREVETPANEARQPCLNAPQLAELAKLVLRVETSYGFPQDIEWGFANGRLHLLQSRPVTSIPPRWTRDESAERFPNVITPLTWDFVEEGFHRSLDHSLRLMGLPTFNGKWFGMQGHYIYGNQNAVELYARRSPVDFRSLDELRAALPLLRAQFPWVLELPINWSRDLDFYLIRLGEFMTEPLAPKSLRDLWQFVLEINAHGADYFLPNIAISITHGGLYRLLHQLVHLAVERERADAILDHLLRCETKTGQINRELFDLARLIRARPALEAQFGGRSSRTLWDDRVLENEPAIAERFGKFLRDHGHREVDFDAYAPTWIECPWIVLDHVRLILNTPMKPPPSETEREQRIRRQQAEFELFQRLPNDLHFFFSELIRLARVYTSLDDLEHYQTTRLTLALRRGLRELGNRLVAQGILPEPMDIFFARRPQIAEGIRRDDAAGWQEFTRQVGVNKAAYLADQARTPEWILGEKNPPAPAMADQVIQGLAGSPGIAEGPVFVVRSPEDFALFPKGAVLVARTTNPAWTPLFYNAAAVVTESGGPLSHGAVTAREMNIPAVMSAKGVLQRLRNGQRIRVNGTRAVVQDID